MVSRTLPDEALYDEARSRGWLTWLAREMQRRSVTVFMLEDLQPACLASLGQRFAYLTLSRLLSVVLVVTALTFVDLLTNQEWSLGAASLITALWSVALIALALGDARWSASTVWRRIIRAVAFLAFVDGLTALWWWISGGSNDDATILLLVFGVTAVVVGSGRPRAPGDDIHTVESLQWSWRRGVPGIAVGAALIAWAVIYTWDWRGDKFDFSDLVVLPAFVVAIFTVLWGLVPGLPRLKTAPNEGLRSTARSVALVGTAVLLVTGIPMLLLDENTTGIEWLDPFPTLDRAYLAGPLLFVTALAVLQFGGRDVIRHWVLRLVLWFTGALPLHLTRFLDYAAGELNLLQKVGGGYIFVHRMLLEHFAGADGRRARPDAGIAALALISLLCLIPFAGGVRWAGERIEVPAVIAAQAVVAAPGSFALPHEATVLRAASARSGVAAPAAATVPVPSTASTAIAVPDEQLLRDGDLIFRSGTGLDSRLIELMDGRFGYSHVGLVDFSGGVAQVVHIEPGDEAARGDVRREALAEFLSAGKAEGFAVYRVKSATPRRVEKALDRVQEFASAGVTFDHRLDLDSADEMYCSELVWRAYLAAGIDLSAYEPGRFRFPLGRRQVVKLSDLAHAPDMELISSFTPAHR